MNEKVFLSVIVPVYNTEKYIAKCLESIISQTYKNLEIIIVNDASNDKSMQIVNSYMKIDNRIRIVEHEVNKGLFQARLTGVEFSQGDYIAFVDSDDYITIDYYRVLIDEAVSKHADIVFANTINVSEDGWNYIYNTYNNITNTNTILKNAEIINKLFEQEGKCFSWHTVWNKIYSRKLWNKCIPYYSRVTDHLIMTEDILFSTVLYYFAEIMTFKNHDGYFYYRHPASSTGNTNTKEKLLKNLKDVNTVFKFVEEFIKEKDIYTKYKPNFQEWKNYYFRIWCNNLETANLEKDEFNLVLQKLCSIFSKNKLENVTCNDNFYYCLTTQWNDNYEKIKRQICDENIEYISFDIFDTLINRPFWNPTDLFLLMNKYFRDICNINTDINFYDMRKHAEQLCRNKFKIEKPFFQDINLNEIYSEMKSFYELPDEIVNKLMQKEIELEIKFCGKKESVNELYELASHLGKKIIIISDMYLPKEVIQSILNKNGFNKHERILLSSSERLLKYSGDLFRVALNKCEIKEPSKLLHIGDNWDADIVAAMKLGIQVAYIPKAKEAFQNCTPNSYTGDGSSVIFDKLGTWIKYSEASSNFSIRCLLAIVANKIFDNPFVSFQRESDFNGNSYFIGYYTLGMHLLGLLKWLIEDASEKKYNTIHFLARDGYLPKKIYDSLKTVYDNSPNSNYFYATRKSLLPYTINESLDFYNIPNMINIFNYTPRDILLFYSNILKTIDNTMEDDYLKNGIVLDSKFTSLSDFNLFIKHLIKLSYNKNLANEAKDKFKSILKNVISSNDATFDIGYSGKLQSILVKNLDQKIDTYYLHSTSESADTLANEKGFKIYNYYNFTPAITGLIREYFISEPGPSCIKYEINKDNLEPIFEEYLLNFSQKFIIEQVFAGATDFVDDVIRIYGSYIKEMNFRPIEISAPFEMYLSSSKSFDKYIFSETFVEDTLHGGFEKISLLKLWEWSSHDNKLNYVDNQNLCTKPEYDIKNILLGKNIFERAMFWYVYDKESFKNRLKKIIRRD